MTDGSYVANLNKEQAEAAFHTEGPLLIVAGAGTGKTKTLTARTIVLIDSGVNAENVLLVTFTNKAAAEMKSRITTALPGEGEGVTACTFHSFCAQILRRNAGLLGYDEKFAIISDDDAKEIASIIASEKKREIESRGLSAKNFPTAGALLSISGSAVNDMISLHDAVMADANAEGFRKETEEALDAYAKYKKDRNMMDYDDLLLNAALVLKNFPDVRRACSNRYRYVMCDEYQDTNVIQDFILDMLMSETGNLAVVGDDNQSIYRFRGARIENILTFAERHPGCRTVVLRENYRSSQEVLDFCNAVMSHATEGVRKDLKGQFRGEKPQLLAHNGKNEQAAFVVSKLKELHDQGIPYKEMAVMARNSAATAVIESELMKEVLGEHIHQFLVEEKRREWQAYTSHVSDWELGEYLSVM